MENILGKFFGIVFVIILTLLCMATIPQIANDIVHDILWDRSQTGIDLSAASQAALIASIVTGIIPVLGFLWIRKIFKGKPDQTDKKFSDARSERDQPQSQHSQYTKFLNDGNESTVQTAETFAASASDKIETMVEEKPRPITPSAAVEKPHITADNIDNYPNAQTVIDYNSQALNEWKKVQALPLQFQIKFLKDLDTNPKLDVIQLSNNIQLESEKSLRPFEDEAVNNAYVEAQNLGDEAAFEFKRVQDLLGSTIGPSDILAKVKEKYAPKINTTAGLKKLQIAYNEKRVGETINALEALGYQVSKAHDTINTTITDAHGVTYQASSVLLCAWLILHDAGLE